MSRRPYSDMSKAERDRAWEPIDGARAEEMEAMPDEPKVGRLKALLSPRYRFRSAVTGEYVSKAYALLHPNTTVREKIDA